MPSRTRSEAMRAEMHTWLSTTVWGPVPGFAATAGELYYWTNGRGDRAESEHTSIDSEVRSKLKIQTSRSAGARSSRATTPDVLRASLTRSRPTLADRRC